MDVAMAKPPVQRRRQALAAIEAEIVRALLVRDRYACRAEACRNAQRPDRRLEVLLRLAEFRLAQLYRSRDVLLHGDEADDGSDPA